MREEYAALLEETRAWFDRAASAGWFDEAERARFEAVERATPADLFAGPARPLVVAFFGGTGVGKSSLLNRLAGEPIAKVGVERPTSREVTLYLHESVELKQLPSELPMDRVAVRRHRADRHREVLWIDAPDIDSVEEANRRCALSWLPHVDLLCYVVSPERYRDDVGWRVLRQRGRRHGWVFIMNRWDEGHARQREDFLAMLQDAGFDAPLLLCTRCAPGAAAPPTPDQFNELENAIQELLQAHAVAELTRLGHRARLQELRQVLERFLARLGDDTAWARVETERRNRWDVTAEELMRGLGWTRQAVAARFAGREGNFLQQIKRQIAGRTPQADGEACATPGPDPGELAALTDPLWDDWAESKYRRFLDAVVLAADRENIRTDPLRRRLGAIGEKARSAALDPVQDAVRTALVHPGGRLRRAARRVTGFLTAALPAVALVVVGYRVVVGYFRAATGAAPFLGTEFAIHSGLLVFLAWLFPYLLDRKLRPSLEQAVLRALEQGYRVGLAEAGELSGNVLHEVREQARSFRQEGETLVRRIAQVMIRPIDTRHPTLARVIARREKRAEALEEEPLPAEPS